VEGRGFGVLPKMKTGDSTWIESRCARLWKVGDLGTRSEKPEEEATARRKPPAKGGHAAGDISRSCLAALCAPRGSRSCGLAVGGCGREEGKATRVGLVGGHELVGLNRLMLECWVQNNTVVCPYIYILPPVSI
jgi:hypothetical protein